MSFKFCKEKLPQWLGFTYGLRGVGKDKKTNLYYKGFKVKKSMETKEISVFTTYGEKKIKIEILVDFFATVRVFTDICQESFDCPFERKKILSVARKKLDDLFFGTLKKDLNKNCAEGELNHERQAV